MGRAERRLVTCVFVDVVESTDLTMRLGPERMKRVLGDAFADLSALALEHGGTIEKYVGDEIFVIFGAPVAHADDPERALRFGAGAVRWSHTDQRSIPLMVRVGIETGEALVDLEAIGSERQQMAVGGCVNVAARLRGEAEPGEVLVGPACAAGVGEIADLQDLGVRRLKGVGDVPVRRLVQLREVRSPISLPLVGRATELERLGAAFERASGGRASFVLVSGPPGLGKTRLVEELVSSLRDRARILQARCRPGTEQGVNTPQRQLLGSDLVGEVTTDTIQARLATLLSDEPERRRIGEGLAHGAGLAAVPRILSLRPEERLDELALAWRRYLAVLAETAPVVVWIEDLHWADPLLARLLERLWLDLAVPLLVVATARPEVGVASLRPHPDRVVLELDPLDNDSARALARTAGNERAAERGEGNALFILELARVGATHSALPLTLHGAIAARLDELLPADRELLQRAAIAGESFGVRDAALLADRDPAEVAGVLGRLAHLRYVRPVDGLFRFHHALVRDVAYSRLPLEERLRLHARFASECVHPDDAEALAHHWWEALGPAEAEWVWGGEPLLAQMRRDARRAHIVAAQREADRGALDAALSLLDRARQLAREPSELGEVAGAIAFAYQRNARGDECWEHFLEARDAYRAAAAPVPASLYAQSLVVPTLAWGYFRKLPDEALVRALTDEGIAVARRSGDPQSLAALLVARAAFTGDSDSLDESLALVDASTELGPFATTLFRIGETQYFRGDVLAALDSFARLERSGALELLNDADLFVFRAAAAYHEGDLAFARATAERALTLSGTRSAHTRQHALAALSLAHFGAGEWDDVRADAAALDDLVERHPGASFCLLGAGAAAAGAIAEARAGGGLAELPSFLVRLVPESAMLRASALLLPRAVSGVTDVDDAALAAYERTRGRWDRQSWDCVGLNPVLALIILERWDDLAPHLDRLDHFAAQGSRLAGALVLAAREEVVSSRGGSRPRHEALRSLGYSGISDLLSFRPR